MADVKQILVVDDHFEMLEFLRSMLELSNRDYQVLGVPSAEEGFLELRRTPFDLLITDVRLPGMSGFELVRKVTEFNPQLPIIMITAYSTSQGKQEAETLGVFRYFEKPLDTDALLAAVHATLYQGQPAMQVERGKTVTAGQRADAPGGEIHARLQSLMSDTGADQAILADRNGQILSQVGERGAQPLNRLTRLVAKGLDNSFLLAEELGSSEPFTIEYLAGEEGDLYTANVGRDYFIMLLFGVQSRRGRIGTVWIFAQRAIKDLKTMFAAAADRPAAMLPRAEQLPPPPTYREDPHAGDVPDDVDNEQDIASPLSQPDVMEDVEEPVGEQAAGDVEQGIVREAVPTSPEEPPVAEALGIVDDVQEVDLDAFWEEATREADDDENKKGLSFEEALRRGLLPPEFGDSGS